MDYKKIAQDTIALLEQKRKALVKASAQTIKAQATELNLQNEVSRLESLAQSLQSINDQTPAPLAPKVVYVDRWHYTYPPTPTYTVPNYQQPWTYYNTSGGLTGLNSSGLQSTLTSSGANGSALVTTGALSLGDGIASGND